jgi:hypothetical protein
LLVATLILSIPAALGTLASTQGGPDGAPTGLLATHAVFVLLLLVLLVVNRRGRTTLAAWVFCGALVLNGSEFLALPDLDRALVIYAAPIIVASFLLRPAGAYYIFALSVADYLAPMLSRLTGRQELLLLEPGRSLVGNAGLLLTRVEILKHGAEKNFAVVDTAMNDLARPALYDAYHEIVKVGTGGTAPAAARRYEIVGPVCESGDFLGHDRELALAEGDLLAILSAGAYGMAMSSNYNSRPRAAEIMVDGKEARLIRKRETIAELMANELPYL